MLYIMNLKTISLPAIAIVAALALVMAAASAIGAVQTASAALTCETKSGNAPAGQQDGKDDCQGSKLIKTPSGNAPPGQNP
jgi:hypothetical protein